MLRAIAGHRGIADAQDAVHHVHSAFGVVQKAGASHGGTRRSVEDLQGASEVGVTDVAIDQAVEYERLGGVKNHDGGAIWRSVANEGALTQSDRRA